MPQLEYEQLIDPHRPNWLGSASVASFLTLWTSLICSFPRTLVFKNQRARFVRRGGEPGGEASFIRRVPANRVVSGSGGNKRKVRQAATAATGARKRAGAGGRETGTGAAGTGDSTDRQCKCSKTEREWLQICSGMGTGCSLGSNVSRIYVLEFRNVVELEGTGVYRYASDYADAALRNAVDERPGSRTTKLLMLSLDRDLAADLQRMGLQRMTTASVNCRCSGMLLSPDDHGKLTRGVWVHVT